MSQQRTAVFVMNLVQDVNILRPLVFMAARDFGFRTLILVSSKFAERDLQGIWRSELEQLSAETDSELQTFESDWDAFRALKGCGVIFAGSESSLPGHGTTHALFRYAPPTFLKVTLQHGFECVGFRHSAAHDRVHGRMVSFAADVVCAWQPTERLTSMAPSQRPKALVTGPSAVLQPFTEPFERHPGAPGIVCENLHSVRLNTTSELKGQFVDAFGEFCRLLARQRRKVALRPHPGGQYVLKNKVALPPNARIENAPMYRLDLRQFSYGISAPSSVLIDMLLAGIPTAVWRDQLGSISTDNYAGLTSVSTPDEWYNFSREAEADPGSFLARQERFLADQQMPIEPRDVFLRFAQIFEAVGRVNVAPGARPVASRRFLFIANAHLPTLQVCLERPLSSLVRSGELATDLITEAELRTRERIFDTANAVSEWIDHTFSRFAPDVLIFSRYSGPFAPEMLDWARRNNVPAIYQVDDDLLAVPRDLGERKHAYHNAPERIDAVRALFAGADMVYASTERLRERILDHDPDIMVVTGPINCSGRVMRTPDQAPARSIGYMASADHLPNLMMVLPALEKLLDRHARLKFELFGSIPIPERLARFGERVRKVDPVSDYESFLDRLAERQWDIGICPLTAIEFNLTKSNNKWVEYTSAGIAVVASANMIYDECCADGCGILAGDSNEWFTALERLVEDDGARVEMIARAQHKLESSYGIDQHQRQILEIVEMARRVVAGDEKTRSQSVEEAA